MRLAWYLLSIKTQQMHVLKRKLEFLHVKKGLYLDRFKVYQFAKT